MKKIISLSLALLLIFSSLALMTSCEISAEHGENEGSETPEAVETPAPGRIYGNYQVITVTDEETVELVENMWTHGSWMHIGLMSTNDQMYRVFKEYVMVENTYLSEILERDDAIDLLLWRFDKYAHEAYVPHEAGRAFMYCLQSDVIQARMTEDQKQASLLIFEAIPSTEEREEMYN